MSCKEVGRETDREYTQIGVHWREIDIELEQTLRHCDFISPAMIPMSSCALLFLFVGGGSGLGLFITRAIVNKHDGSVGFESEGLGHGCNFFFNIPVFRLADTPSPMSDVLGTPVLLGTEGTE